MFLTRDQAAGLRHVVNGWRVLVLVASELGKHLEVVGQQIVIFLLFLLLLLAELVQVLSTEFRLALFDLFRCLI